MPCQTQKRVQGGDDRRYPIEELEYGRDATFSIEQVSHLCQDNIGNDKLPTIEIGDYDSNCVFCVLCVKKGEEIATIDEDLTPSHLRSSYG